MKLSIITINLNNCNGLQKTIDSVVAQTFKDFEWIVIDGGSTDGSKELIEQYADHFAYWVSEPDKGIYNAMNKGIKVAKGEYLQFLNSGDWLADEMVLQDFVDAAFSEDVVDGDIRLLYEDKEEFAKAPEAVDFDFFYHHGTIWHQTAFIRKSLFEKYGQYEEQYRIISDWEFFMRVLTVHGASYKHFNRLIAVFPVDGISADNSFEQEKNRDAWNAYLRFIPEKFLEAYCALDEEVQQLQKVKDEYDNLRNGRFGFIIRFLLRLKEIKKSQPNV